MKLTSQLVALIKSRLQQTWSPEELIGAELDGILSFKTIYSWIHRGFLAVTKQVLRRKGKKPSTQETRGGGGDSVLSEPLKNDHRKLKTVRSLSIGN